MSDDISHWEASSKTGAALFYTSPFIANILFSLIENKTKPLIKEFLVIST